MADDEAPTVKVFRVMLHICELCLSGAGGHCYVPGCAFWMMRAPSAPLCVFMKASPDAEPTDE